MGFLDSIFGNKSAPSKHTEELASIDINALRTLSYRECRQIYREWFIGKRVVEALPRYALSSGRQIVIQDAPQEAIEQFEKTFAKYDALKVIKQFCFYKRIYGLAGIYVATEERDKRENLLKHEALEKEIFFNVCDPLIMSGVFISQDPLDKNFQKITGATINGQKVGGSRFFAMFNGTPLYLDFTGSTYNYAGVSVYNNMQDLIRLWGELFESLRKISIKASSILITGTGGGFTDGTALDIKAQNAEFMRNLKDGVAQMPAGTTAEFFNLSGIAEINSIINELRAMLAMALDDTPATILLDKDFSKGLGDGSEEMNAVIMAVENYRNEYLKPVFDFLDSYLFYKAWDDDFINKLRMQYPEQFNHLGNNQIRQSFIDGFSYEFDSVRPPTLDEETKRKTAILEMLLKAKDLGAVLACIEKELNESKVFANTMELAEVEIPEFDGELGGEDLESEKD